MQCRGRGEAGIDTHARQPGPALMQARVHKGPGLKNLEDRARPVAKLPGDAIVRITKTTICGTDLHILKGDVATCRPGTAQDCGHVHDALTRTVRAFAHMPTALDHG
jgi:hypothetical protein